MICSSLLFENSSKLFVKRAQKEIGRVGAGRARPRGQRRRSFGQGKFEPERKRRKEKARKFKTQTKEQNKKYDQIYSLLPKIN